MSSYNIKNHVASDIPNDHYFVDAKNLQTQTNLDKISEWTNSKNMMFNKVKSKVMIFNFSNTNKFTTRLNLDGQNLEVVDKMKILGTILTNTLKWDDNTKELVTKANARMQILRKISTFKAPIEDLKIIYIMYIRSILEQSCVVWNKSLTKQNIEDLERVQKNAFRLILGENYICYTQACEFLNLQNLQERRNVLTYKFSMKCPNT